MPIKLIKKVKLKFNFDRISIMPKIKIIVLQHVEHEDLENIENFFPSNKFEFK